MVVVVVVVVTDRLTHVFAKQGWQQQVRARFVSPGVSLRLVLVFSACLAANTADAASCGEESGLAAISACDKELARDPDSIEVRLRYADVLMGQRQYQQAVNILRDALAMQPGNDTIKQKYRLASSLAEEQQSIDQLSTDTPAAGTRNSVQEILCKTLKGQRAISACDQVLATDPRNITALTRRGDELMALNQVGDAVASYRRAVALEPANPTLLNNLARAESKLPAKPPIEVAKVKPVTKAPKATTVTIAQSKQQTPVVQTTPEPKSKPIEPTARSKKQTPVEQPAPEPVLKPKTNSTDTSVIAAIQPVESKTNRVTPDTTAGDGDQSELDNLQISTSEVIVKYNNASFANGSTY